MKQVLLVTATKTKTYEEFLQRPLAASLSVLCDKRYVDDTFDFEVVKDNKDGLPAVYNRYINEKNKNKIVVFAHDDLEIHDLNLVEKLNQSPWDITGLAGGSNFALKDKNLWHICSDPQTLSGAVSHFLCWQQDNQIQSDKTKQATTVFGPWPQRCLVLDGLFLAVNVERALETNFQFDERHTFHHYDISSCLIANEKKLKMGTYPIFCFHHGLGDSYMSPEWEDSNKKFIENWKKALKTS
jgi:hypothetical protein